MSDGQREYYGVVDEFLEAPKKTLRDEFAMAALAGLFRHHGWINPSDYEEIAKRAYAQADAMLAARAP